MAASKRGGSERVRVTAIAVLLLLAAAPAEGRTVTVRWRWPNLEPGRQIAGFKLYTRHLDQAYGPGLDVGLPPEQDGVYSVSLEVSDSDATYVSATAYDARGLESPRSNEKLFLLPEP
jgi:hypothetical protein